MTIQVEHTTRTADVRPRILPCPSDDAGWTVETVAAIAGVDLSAHTLAHPVPQHGCPFGGCAGAGAVFREPTSELTWIEDARVSPVRHEVAA